MGLQHMLAMLAGVITPPLLISDRFNARFSSSQQNYLIAAALISSGLLSIVQITQFRLPFGYVLGTGMNSVLGVSFGFLEIGRTTVKFVMGEDSTNECSVDADCLDAWAGQFGPKAGLIEPGVTNMGQCNLDTGFCKNSGQAGYGAFIGTCIVCSLLEILISFLPKETIKRMFPAHVTGVCVFLIGASLTGTGLKYWGGGAFCADNAHKRFKLTAGPDFMGDYSANYTQFYSTSPCLTAGVCSGAGPLSGVCAYTPHKYDATLGKTIGDQTKCEDYDSPVGNSMVNCGGNGQVFLPFGSPEYIGLGFVVFSMLIFIECFGSPFLRNCGVVISLIIGFIVAGSVSYYPPGSDNGLKYVTPAKIDSAPWGTFLWVETFPLTVYAPAVLPVLLAFVVSTAETVGDIGATAEASRLPTDTISFDQRVQGGLLADGIGSLLAGLMMVPPNTTFSQNSGVVAITRCANKRAGYMCCFFLILFGIVAKLAGVLQSIPDCVLGGLTTFCFINVCVSGIRVFERANLRSPRNRFIVAASLALGLGVTIVPKFFMNSFFSKVNTSNDKTLSLFIDGIEILLSTPYSIGTILALVLNLILPEDIFGEPTKDVDHTHYVEQPMAFVPYDQQGAPMQYVEPQLYTAASAMPMSYMAPNAYSQQPMQQPMMYPGQA